LIFKQSKHQKFLIKFGKMKVRATKKKFLQHQQKHKKHEFGPRNNYFDLISNEKFKAEIVHGRCDLLLGTAASAGSGLPVPMM
jgi:hypothetical protein